MPATDERQTYGKQRFEFKCGNCPSGGGWIMMLINIKHRGSFKIKCPKCGHIHDRHFVDGEIKDVWTEVKSGEIKLIGPQQLIVTRSGRQCTEQSDLFEPTMAAWSKESRIEKLDKEFLEKVRGSGRPITTAELWTKMGQDDLDFTVEKKDNG